jgi:hypothetical protein
MPAALEAETGGSQFEIAWDTQQNLTQKNYKQKV